MVTRVMFAGLLVVLFSSSGYAQQATAYDKGQDDRITALEKRIKDAEGSIASHKSDFDKKLENLTALIAEHTTQIGAVSNALSTQTDLIGKLRTDVGKLAADTNTLSTDINTELNKIRKNLDDISRDDGGRYVPRISAAMDASNTFREDMDKAVHRSLKTRGKFQIINKTSSYQWILVNRTEQFLRPGETLNIDVPVGTVTTQLPGQGLVNWTLAHVGNGEYWEGIEIVPSRSPIRTIVDSPGLVGPPLYTDPPVYAGSTAMTSQPALPY